jgi:hypothetical protein
MFMPAQWHLTVSEVVYRSPFHSNKLKRNTDTNNSQKEILGRGNIWADSRRVKHLKEF